MVEILKDYFSSICHGIKNAEVTAYAMQEEERRGKSACALCVIEMPYTVV